MDQRVAPTPFADVNIVLDHFRSQLQALFASDLVGIYLVGSLALGDFNPRRSDHDCQSMATTGSSGPDLVAMAMPSRSPGICHSNSLSVAVFAGNRNSRLQDPCN